MECSSFDPYASPRNDVGDVVSYWPPIQAVPGVHGSIEHGLGDGQRQKTARLEGDLRIIMFDNREIIHPSSNVKCILGPSDAVIWMHPIFPTSGARRGTTYKEPVTPMAGDSHPGHDMANTRIQGDYDALVSDPDPSMDNAEIGHSGGHAESDWPSQSNHTSSVHSNLHGNSSSLRGRMVAVYPVDEGSSWNSMKPMDAVQPFSIDQPPYVEQHYDQNNNNASSNANTPRHRDVPTISVNQASNGILAHANTSNPLAYMGSAGSHGPEYASVRPDTLTQALHPGGNPIQADLGLQQGDSPLCQEEDHLGAYYGSHSPQEAPTPKVAIVLDAGYGYQEPGFPCAPRQSDPDSIRRESNSKRRRSRSLRAPHSLSHDATSPSKSKGRRTGPLNAAQKEHAKIVRNAGLKDCECRHRKVRCTHVVAENPQAPGALGSGTSLAATPAQRDTAMYGEPDTPSSQNTSWLTETTPVSPFTSSRNQSFGNPVDLGSTLDMSSMNLLIEDYQPVHDVDDAEGDTDDEEMLEMDLTSGQ